jgi:hypothetical protein
MEYYKGQMLYCIKDYIVHGISFEKEKQYPVANVRLVGLEYGHRTPATELVMVDDNQILEIFTTPENWFISIKESRRRKIKSFL